MKESREGFRRRGRGRSFHVEGPKTKKGVGTYCGKSGTINSVNELSIMFYVSFHPTFRSVFSYL